MTKYKNLSSPAKNMLTTFAMVIGLFVILQILLLTGSVSSLVKGQLVPICAYIVMAVSLNLTVGILGELSLGHAGFMSVGAFSGVVMSFILKQAGASDGLRLFVSILTGCIFGAIVGFLIGIPVLRLKGDYLAIVTLAFGEIIKSIMNNLYIGLDASGLHVNMLKDTLNMTDGQVIISGPMGVSGNDKLSTFFAGFLLILICLFVIFNFVDSRAGRAVAAQRDNFIATESVGINITKYKLTAFTISAGMAGMAGTLFALNYSTVVASKFDFNTSILVLVFVVLGGLGNMKGSIIAAIVLTLLPELLRAFSTYRMLLYAIVLIIIMLITNNPEMKHAAETALSWIKGLFSRKKGGAVND
ncbi:MAG: branched-chain amino acid ABC transporter permease [Clostridiales bacterium]|nr:branched-chain amino acid ABC transporter permease [Clostridiales bacterium]